jgi:hypothetical protein
MSARRDLDRERRFLRGAAPLAPPFREHASRRLVTGEQEYGDSWATRGLADLLLEISEECADIGAWCALTEQALELSDIDPGDREHVSSALLCAARMGALAWARINQAQRLLDTIGWDGAA